MMKPTTANSTATTMFPMPFTSQFWCVMA